VELIGVGASPTYGSGAIAGTANYLLKNDIQGVQVLTEYGTSDYGDGQSYRTGLLGGSVFGEGKGRFSLAYEYHQQKIIHHNSRAFTAKNARYVALDNTNQLMLQDNIRNVSNTAYGIPSPAPSSLNFFGLEGDQVERNYFVDSQMRPLAFNSIGELQVFDPGTPTQSLNLVIGGDGERLSDYYAIRLPFTREALYASLDYAFFPKLRFKSQLLYSEFSTSTPVNDVLRTVGDAIYEDGFGDALAVAISIDDPFLRDQDRQLIESQLNGEEVFYLHKAWSDVGGATIEEAGRVGQLRLTADSDFLFVGRPWNFNAYLSYGVSQLYNTSDSRTCVKLFSEAGFYSCNDDSQFAGFDLESFRRFGRVNAEDSRQFSGSSTLSTQSMFSNIALGLRSELFSLPGGEISWSMGYEYLHYGGRVRKKTPDILASSKDDIDNHFYIREAYAELYLPVLDADVVPLLSELTSEMSYRISQVSRGMSDRSAAYGVRAGFDIYKDVHLLLRGVRTRSYRSPSFIERFLPFQLTYSLSADNVDPCYFEDVSGLSESQNIIENCERHAQTLQESGGLSGAFEYDPEVFARGEVYNQTVEGYMQGNPNIENEKGLASSLGLTLNIKNAYYMSADLVDINVTKAVGGLADSLLGCYVDGDSTACDNVKRSSEFRLESVVNSIANLDQFSTRLVQFSTRFPFSTKNIYGGRLYAHVNGQYIKEFNKYATRAASGRYGQPKKRILASINYQNEGFRTALSAEYTGRASYFIQVPSSTVDTIDPFYRMHFSVSHAFYKKLTMSLSVRNLLNTEPPKQIESIDAKGIYSAEGRYYLLTTTLKLQ